MSRLNPNAGAFVPSFSMPAAVATPAAAATVSAAATPAPAVESLAPTAAAAAKSPGKPSPATPAPIVTAAQETYATVPKAGATPSGKATPSAKQATTVAAKATVVTTPSDDDATVEDVEMDGAAASDRLVYAIDYLLQFQPICDAVPCYFPDVVRAPAPQRLGRYINDRLVYTVPELLHFQPLYQMFPPDLEWSDTLAIVVESVDKKHPAAPAKLSKKEKAKARAAAAAAATTGATATDQLQYDPTLMCYFNPTEYAAALNMAVYGSATKTDKASSALPTKGATAAEPLNPVEEAVAAKRRLAALLDEMQQPESVPTVLQAFEEIAITCTHTLQEVIGQLFDRAIAEPALCDTFAQLCSGMAERTPEFKEGAKTINFRRILLTRCYEALIEEPESANVAIPSSTTTPDASNAAPSGTTANGTTSTWTAPQHSWRRQCMLRNVCFIGELFRRQLLTENIMHVCVAMMLEDEVNPQMDVIDAACRLLMLVGDLLDGSSPASRRTMDEYFDVLQRLAEHSAADQALKETIAEMTSVRVGGWAKKRLDATAGVASPAKPGSTTTTAPLTPLASTVATAIAGGGTSVAVAAPVQSSSEATVTAASDAVATSVSS